MVNLHSDDLINFHSLLHDIHHLSGLFTLWFEIFDLLIYLSFALRQAFFDEWSDVSFIHNL